jgi:hypothetical protein
LRCKISKKAHGASHQLPASRNRSMKLTERTAAFTRLAGEIDRILEGHPQTETGKKLAGQLPSALHFNGWYTPENLRHRLRTIAGSCREEVLAEWIAAYKIPDTLPMRKILVILAANIPLVGFDDFRCVLISGNQFVGKLSSDDQRLLPLLSEALVEIEPRFGAQISFTDGRAGAIDAVIATGSNNSARYFEYYFSKYPHIIRRNRNGIAILSGNETNEELEGLGEDIFRYFGLGCRNVTKIFVPQGYDFHRFFPPLLSWGEKLTGHTRYMNNYEYNLTLYLLNKVKLLDNNFLLLKEDENRSSPPGVLFYEYYTDTGQLRKKLEQENENIQCIIGNQSFWPGAIPFGKSQETFPWDYADGVDVMEFLLGN